MHPVTRRAFLKYGATAVAGSVVAAAPGVAAGAAPPQPKGKPIPGPARWLEEKSIAELQAAMTDGGLSATRLTRAYLRRIRRLDPHVNSMIETNPDAIDIARRLDAERKSGIVRGPLHGIPIVVKDNVDTDDKMQTTAGSLALLGSKPQEDSTTAARLRDAGAIILGKAGLSEWANFRSFQSSSGWSARGGQVRNPYVLDRNPCGSSSGSGAAPSANLAAAAIGTETDGSIVCPSSACGLAGIKPTVGLTSRAGVVPISRTQDTIGPMARTVADAAAVLGALTGVDPRDPATAASDGNSYTDYSQFIDANGLDGARIGVARNLFGFSPEADAVMEEAIALMASAGAVIVDPTNLDNASEIGAPEFEVLLYEFKTDIALYLETRTPGSPRDLAGLIDFNNANAEEELKWFGQGLFELSESKGPLTDQAYLDALELGQRLAGEEGIDKVLADNNLDAIVAPTGSPAWPTDLINGDHFLGGSSSMAAVAGYPLVTVTAGYSFGLPVGITFMGGAWSEPTLIKLASGFEAVRGARKKPRLRRRIRKGWNPPA